MSCLLALVLALLSPVAGYAQSLSCPKGLKSQAVAEMIFGRNIGEIAGAVSEEEWLRFVDEVVTPRFPDGLTVIDAYGQWWNPPEGRIEREPAKLLLVVLTREAAAPAPRRDRAAYKRRFSQQSVIVMLRRACVTF